MSSNLPPGVTESMIPGNRPEDQMVEEYQEAIADVLTELAFRGTHPAAIVAALETLRDEMDRLPSDPYE